MGELVESLITQTVSGDTHAASLAGSNTLTADAVADTKGSVTAFANGASNVTSAIFSADLGIADTTIRTLAAMTPKTAVNVIHLAAAVQVHKITNAGTVTINIKEGAAVLFSMTTASLAVGDDGWPTIDGAVSNATVAAHTYLFTIVASTTGVQWGGGLMYGTVIERGAIVSTSQAVGTDTFGGANSISVGKYSATFNVETTIATATAITPSNAKNAIILSSIAHTAKITNAGTITYRIKESTTTLVSFTTASYSASALGCNGVDGTNGPQAIYDQTAVAHTYTLTAEASTSGMKWRDCSLYVQPVSGISGSDTHSANLTGSAGSCV